MAVNYDKLFHMLIDKRFPMLSLPKKQALVLTLLPLKGDQYVAMESIEKIYHALNCGVDDILDFTK